MGAGEGQPIVVDIGARGYTWLRDHGPPRSVDDLVPGACPSRAHLRGGVDQDLAHDFDLRHDTNALQVAKPVMRRSPASAEVSERRYRRP